MYVTPRISPNAFGRSTTAPTSFTLPSASSTELHARLLLFSRRSIQSSFVYKRTFHNRHTLRDFLRQRGTHAALCHLTSFFHSILIFIVSTPFIFLNRMIPYLFYILIPTSISSLHNNKPVYRLQQQSIRRLVLVPPYFVFCSISFRCGGLSIERNQKPLTPENTLAVTHHDKQKQVEVKRSSRANPHEIRLFSGCPYAVVK